MTPTKNPLLLPPPYRFLEAVRGIAALWVVAFHALILMVAFDPAVANHPLILPFYKGFLGVEVFFVVSGYCIANAACSALNKPRPLGSYAFARVRRIFPPCWASLVFFAFAALATTWFPPHGPHAEKNYLAVLDVAHQTFMFYFTNLTLTQILFHQQFLSIVCWTLCYELAFYLIVAVPLSFAVLLRPAGSAPQFYLRRMLSALHCLTFICCGFLLLAPNLLPYPFDLWAQFGLGVALFDAVRSRNSLTPRLILFSLFILLLIFLLTQNVLIGYTRETSRWTYSTALVAAAILYAFHALDSQLMHLAPVRFAAFVGHFSYSLYLINFLAVSGLMMLVRRLNLSPAAHVAGVYLITLLILIPAYIFFFFFERPFLGHRSTSRLVKTTPAPLAEFSTPLPAVATITADIESAPTPVTASPT